MKASTRQLLLEAWSYCDKHDKSTEFMLQFMQDMAGVDLDCVINFLEKEERKRNRERNRKLSKQ